MEGTHAPCPTKHTCLTTHNTHNPQNTQIRKHFPEFPDKSPADLHAALNVIKDPSFIRVEADEVCMSSCCADYSVNFCCVLLVRVRRVTLLLLRCIRVPAGEVLHVIGMRHRDEVVEQRSLSQSYCFSAGCPSLATSDTTPSMTNLPPTIMKSNKNEFNENIRTNTPQGHLRHARHSALPERSATTNLPGGGPPPPGHSLCAANVSPMLPQACTAFWDTLRPPHTHTRTKGTHCHQPDSTNTMTNQPAHTHTQPGHLWHAHHPAL